MSSAGAASGIETERTSPRPSPFGVIAGGCGTPAGHNPLIKGDDDLVVTVEETRLPGAADFRTVAARHGHLVSDPLVQQYALSFLTSGYFTSAAERRPIAAEPVLAAPMQQ